MSNISSLVENCLDLGRLYLLPVFTCATIAWLDQQISPGSKYIVLLELTTTISKKLGLSVMSCCILIHYLLDSYTRSLCFSPSYQPGLLYRNLRH